MIDTACQTVDIRAPRASDTALRWLAVALLLCSLATVLYVRLRLLNLPLERDEGEYAYAGQQILDGAPPYQHVYNMKMPGTYLAYAAIMAVFGETPAGIHMGLLLVNLSSIFLTFLLARRFLSFPAAVVSASAYALLALSPAFLGIAAHATHFVVLCVLLGLWMLLRFEANCHWTDCFSAGIFFGTAFLMKQPGMFFGIFGGLYVIYVCLRGTVWRSDQTKPKPARWLVPPLVYAVGLALPFLTVCCWLKIAGVFPQFWFWTIDYARQYVAILSFTEGLKNAAAQFILTFISATMLWAAGLFGAVLLGTKKQHINGRIFLVGFVVFSFAAVCPGWYFRSHYFIVLLPSAALLVGVAVEWSLNWFRATPWLRLLPILVVAVALAQTLVLYRDVLFTAPLADVNSSTYHDNPFMAALEVAQHIKLNTSPADRIAVVGSEPEIYFYAHRPSSTGYIYTYPLMEPQPFARKMQAQMIHEIEEDPPVYLVLVSVQDSVSSIHYWDKAPRQMLFNWVNEYVSRNMHLEGMIQLDNGRLSKAAWGTKASELAPTGSCLLIYRRNDR